MIWADSLRIHFPEQYIDFALMTDGSRHLIWFKLGQMIVNKLKTGSGLPQILQCFLEIRAFFSSVWTEIDT